MELQPRIVLFDHKSSFIRALKNSLEMDGFQVNLAQEGDGWLNDYEGGDDQMILIEASMLTRLIEDSKALTDENRRLTKLAEAKAQFIRLITHELQSPISAVENYLKLILGGYVPEEKEEEILQKCILRTEEERMLIADLLELGHLEVRDSFQLEQVNLYYELIKILNDCREAADEKNLEITLEADPDIPNIETAPEQVRSLWCNLISNAIKYTPANGRITISLIYKDGEIQGGISDTGIGIPSEDQGRLFSEFFRARNAREEGIPGTGLGLAIVKRILEGLGGRISVKSKTGQGTTFNFWIPVPDEIR